MNFIEQEIIWQNETFLINIDKSLYWPSEQILILSDLHLGKGAHFRKHGIAIPQSVQFKDLDRLQNHINHYEPKQLFIVGDFVHAGKNKEVNLVKAFIENNKNTSFHLIKGNHDLMKLDHFYQLGLSTIAEHVTIKNIILQHEWNEKNTKATISGHIHPGVQIRFKNRSKLSLPAFLVSERNITLPAFSNFTGLDTLSKRENTAIYAVHTEGIFKIEY
jgi:DNA ligase-associated metallophosphoesterase